MRTKKLKKSVSVAIVFMLSLSLFPVGIVEAMVVESEVADPENIDVTIEAQGVTTTEATLIASYDLNGETLDEENSKFEVSNDNGATWTTVEESHFDETSGVAEVKNLTPETTYTYQATVVSSEGVSATSEVASFTTLAVPVEEVLEEVAPTEVDVPKEGISQEVIEPEEAVIESPQLGSTITINLSETIVDQPGYTVDNSTHTIIFNEEAKNYSYTITGTANSTYRFVIPVGDESSPIDITLNNVTIVNTLAPIELENEAHVNLHLEGTNTVTCEGTDNAGIQVPSSASITIDGSGSLTANGGDMPNVSGGAGIGASGGSPDSGVITINSGTIVATGGENAAGIGAVLNGSCGEIYINGGDITATGGFNGAGIGGGNNNQKSQITITDGTIKATGGKNGAGIGGGYDGNGGKITITGGTVEATGGQSAAGIGGGKRGNATILISGEAQVEANGGLYAAGVGGGEYSNGGSVTIEAPANVTAIGGKYAAGIGSGNLGTKGQVSIAEGANVKAFTWGYKAAIESKQNENGADNPASIVNVTLRSISKEFETTLKLIDETGAEIANSGMTLPTSYNCFAMTTGSYEGELVIEAYSPDGAYLGNVVDFCTLGNIESNKTLERSIGKLEYIPVESIIVNPSELSLNVGEGDTLSVEFLPEDASNQDVVWTSSDENVATVDVDGYVEAVGTGSAVITCTSADGGYEATSTVTVVQPVSGVEVTPSELNLLVGEEAILVANVLPADASNKNVTWKSSDEGVAKVDEKGSVTAVGTGSSTITCTTEDGGFTATTVVSVEAPVVPVLGVDDEGDQSGKTSVDETTKTDEDSSKENSPETGEETILLTVLIALVSGCAIIYIGYIRKRLN